jgi:hypothetical protein
MTSDAILPIISNWSTISCTLYNVKVKVDSLHEAFKSNKELPTRRAVDMKSAKDMIHLRLDRIFTEKDEWKEKFGNICIMIIEKD